MSRGLARRSRRKQGEKRHAQLSREVRSCQPRDLAASECALEWRRDVRDTLARRNVDARVVRGGGRRDGRRGSRLSTRDESSTPFARALTSQPRARVRVRVSMHGGARRTVVFFETKPNADGGLWYTDASEPT